MAVVGPALASYATFSAVSGSPCFSNSLSMIITCDDHQLCNGGSYFLTYESLHTLGTV